MGFLQQFHLVINYKKGIQNKVADMLSRPPTNASIVIQQSPLVHANYVNNILRMKISKKFMNH